MANYENRYLYQRGHAWNYKRRVPSKYKHVDSRSKVRASLETKSLDIARIRRDAMERADEAYWAALANDAAANQGVTEATQRVQSLHYEAAKTKALTFGFIYKTAQEIYDDRNIDDAKGRVMALAGQFDIPKEKPPTLETKALLGGIQKPKREDLTVSQCFAFYVNEIEFDAQLKKSPAQRKSWENSKRVSVDYFVKVVGDLGMTEITRDHAIKFRNWWADRIKNGDENGKRPTPYTANRRIGNMRTLHSQYFAFIGEEDRANPFRKLSFKDADKNKRKRPPFSIQWTRNKILRPGALEGLNIEARSIFLAIIETGARPSEICNLLPENIHLNHNVPHVEIRERSNREVKASASNRDIPLLGVSLEAMKANPDGFPRYFDKDTHLSNTLMKFFQDNQLLESDKHTIYSVRHSFEDRMLEAGIDHDLRCTLMGHKLKRPLYGSGGSLAYKRDELSKIVHPYDEQLLI